MSFGTEGALGEHMPSTTAELSQLSPAPDWAWQSTHEILPLP